MPSLTRQHVNSSVPAETWDQAQQWEKEFWLRQQKQLAKYGKNLMWRILSAFGRVERFRGDDDNRWWAQQFEGYEFLPSHVEHMIEVGCGPYTNARLAMKRCRPEHLVLSDPLIATYAKFRMTLVREMADTGGCHLDDHPLENLPFRDELFDVALMVNVLDHVRDAAACMTNLNRVVRPGGIVVIGQDLTDAQDLASHPRGMRTGHPITLDADWFEPHLAQFEPLLRRILPRNLGRTAQWHCGTLIFAGTKRAR